MGERDVFAGLCRQLPQLRDTLAGAARDEFDRKLPELRAGTITLLDFCRAVGISTAGGVRDGGPRFGRIPGVAQTPFVAGQYACPGSQCARMDPRDGNGVAPWCNLFDAALRRLPDASAP